MQDEVTLRQADDGLGTCYVEMPGHERAAGFVKRTVDLAELVEDYRGPGVYLDFNEAGELVGIEVLPCVSNGGDSQPAR